MDDKLGISVAVLRPIAEWLGQLGEDSAAFLSAIGVEPNMPVNAFVPGDVVDRELDAIAARRGDPGLGLALIEMAIPRPRGPFSQMIWLSGTLGEALERMIRHYSMASPRRVFQLEIDGTIARFRSRPASATITVGRVLTEFLFAQLVVRARVATGGAFTARAVRFRHAGNGGPRYRELFGVDPEFNASHDEVELDTAQLELRFETADADTSSVLEAKMTALARPQPTFLDQLRRAISASFDASSQELAQALGMSERTLRRRLDEHGTSLRSIADQLRREHADELLASGMSVKDVAVRLGFSEPSAFSRAYKRWSGQPPKARRAGH